MESSQKKSISIKTLGCRLNFFESDGILNVLKKFGYSIRDSDGSISHVIINTCTVTSKADSKNRNIIRQAIKNHPGAKIWVTGCYAETDRAIIESIPGVYRVLGNSEKSSLAYKIVQEDKGSECADLNLDQFSYSDVLPEGHTRAYLKIQDGCNRTCSYCKIPLARGKGVSRRYRDVLDQVKFLQDSGIGEIVLTGVNLGWYRNEKGEKSFLSLLEDILQLLDYSRLRISSIEPPDVGRELAFLMQHPRFCKFLHVPLQSGSAKILKLMRRTYNPVSFRKRIENMLDANPGIFLGTDVIVGFPGEGEEEFNETISLLTEYKFSRIHAFPYSVRKGTLASGLGDPVPREEKKQRIQKLIGLSMENMRKYIEANYGRVLEAIVESNGNLITDNYIRGKLELPIPGLVPGQFLDVKVKSYTQSSDTEVRALFCIAKTGEN